jgi:hypothetical protein
LWSEEKMTTVQKTNPPVRKLTPLQRRRATYDALVASLAVPKNQSIASAQLVKQKPAAGVFGSI